MVDGLGARGADLWSHFEISGVRPGTPAGEVALEACRTADRLDWLDRYIATESAVSMLSEARQHALVLSRLVAEVERLTGGAPAAAPADAATGGGSIVDEIRARREARSANA